MNSHKPSKGLRCAIIAACILVPFGPAAAQTGQSAQPIAEPPARDKNTTRKGFDPLPLKQCLRPERARGWAYIANDELLVDAGRRKYRITLTIGCSALSVAQFIGFQSGHGTGRICGMPQDYLRTDAGRCRIRTVELIPDEYYDQSPGRRGSLTVQKGDGKVRSDSPDSTSESFNPGATGDQ